MKSAARWCRGLGTTDIHTVCGVCLIGNGENRVPSFLVERVTAIRKVRSASPEECDPYTNHLVPADAKQNPFVDINTILLEWVASNPFNAQVKPIQRMLPPNITASPSTGSYFTPDPP